LRRLMLKYPDDKLYSLVLQYRSIDKLAGTYVGRPIE
jgi:DNA polymerase I-like protein with 3'-5' exonuclease and polymerase domains